jgi:inorganic pyrophosphatase
VNLDKVTSGRDVPNDFNVIIEIPQHGDPIKYEVDKETGAMFVDRFMSTAMHYPCRPVGMLKMTDEAGVDAKLIAVPVDKLCGLYKGIKKPEDFSPLLLNQIAHFFEHYKDLEPNKWVKVEGWVGVDEAKAEILAGVQRYQQASPKPNF